MEIPSDNAFAGDMMQEWKEYTLKSTQEGISLAIHGSQSIKWRVWTRPGQEVSWQALNCQAVLIIGIAGTGYVNRFLAKCTTTEVPRFDTPPMFIEKI